MQDDHRTKEQFVGELAELRQRVAELEAVDTERKQAEEALRQSLTELQNLQHVTQALLELDELPQTINTIAKGIVTHLGFDSALVIRYVEEEQVFIGLALYPMMPGLLDQALALIGRPDLRSKLQGYRLPYQPGMNPVVDRVLAGETVISNSLTDFLQPWLPRPVAEAVYKLFGRRTYIDSPMRIKGQTVGKILAGVSNGSITADRQQALARVADQAAMAIHNARLYEAAQQELAERKRTEEALRESEERFRGIFENATIGLYRTTPDGRILMANPTLLRMLGCSSFEELVQRNLEEEGFEPEYPRSDFKQRIESEGQVIGLESAWTKRDGTTLFIRESARAIRDEAGNTLYYEGTVEDITERKRAEEKLKEYAERLEEMVGERTKELREAQEQLVRREKLAMLGQLAGSVAHELRNPLGAISNATFYIKMVLPDVEETIKEHLDIIVEEVHESDRIISDLLDFSRTRIPNRERIEVSELVTDVLAKHSPPENVEVAINIPDQLPVYVDPCQMRQVLDNLVTNACQAMPGGGNLIISAQAGERTVALSVADTGVGISEEVVARLFEPLFTTKAKGLGLGLAVVKMLVEANEGSIEVESEVGKGSTFTVRLPLAK